MAVRVGTKADPEKARAVLAYTGAGAGVTNRGLTLTGGQGGTGGGQGCPLGLMKSLSALAMLASIVWRKTLAVSARLAASSIGKSAARR